MPIIAMDTVTREGDSPDYGTGALAAFADGPGAVLYSQTRDYVVMTQVGPTGALDALFSAG